MADQSSYEDAKVARPKERSNPDMGCAMNPEKRPTLIRSASIEELLETLYGKVQNLENGRRVHELKTMPRFFEKILDGSKPWEFRINDRKFKQGDILILREHEYGRGLKSEGVLDNYSGRAIVKEVGFILDSSAAGIPLPSGHVIMTLLNIGI